MALEPPCTCSIQESTDNFKKNVYILSKYQTVPVLVVHVIIVTIVPSDKWEICCAFHLCNILTERINSLRTLTSFSSLINKIVQK